MIDYAARRKKLLALVRKQGCPALLVSNFNNVSYLTGFTGDDSYLLLTPDRAVVISDSRYTEQLEGECPDLEVECRGQTESMVEAIEKVCQRAKLSRIGIEASSLTLSTYNKMCEKLAKLELVATEGLVEQLREIKDKFEIEAIRGAVHIAEKALAVIRAALRPDQTELQVAHDLEHQMRAFGARGCSFPPIVAVGPRAALPHANPTERRIGESDFVLIDWGAQYGAYKSDLTRVLATGKLSPKLERIYRLVLKANEAGIAAIRPGVTGAEVDAAARKVIEKGGHGKHFGHGLGHGIGIDIHENPRMGKSNKSELKPGMVITVEPGIYLPGWGGVRIEDDVLVTRDGHEVLSTVSKQWEDIMA